MASSALFVLASLLAVASAAKVPPTWKVCKRSLPLAEYETCIYDAVAGAAMELTKNGAPSLGIPPMDPLKITTLEIGKGNGPVAVEMKFEDLKLANLNTVVIDKIRHKDAEKFRFGADVHLKKPLLVDAKYELQGKVLVLPIKGKGDVHLELDNFRAYMNLSGTSFKKGDDEYFKLENFDVDFDTDKLHLKFENLFDGNKELGDNMNVFLNENWDAILKELKPAISEDDNMNVFLNENWDAILKKLKPAISEAISAVFKSIANQIFRVPYSKVFPQ